VPLCSAPAVLLFPQVAISHPTTPPLKYPLCYKWLYFVSLHFALHSFLIPSTNHSSHAANICARLRNQRLHYGFLLAHSYAYLHPTQKSFIERLYHFVL
jgi:hypothetical protein